MTTDRRHALRDWPFWLAVVILMFVWALLDGGLAR